MMSISNSLPNQIDIFEFWQKQQKILLQQFGKGLYFLATWKKPALSAQIYARLRFGINVSHGETRWEGEKRNKKQRRVPDANI